MTLLAATLVKWVALPLGLLMAVGMLCSRTAWSDDAPSKYVTARAMTVIALTAVLVIGLSAYVAYGPSSLYSGAHTFGADEARGALAGLAEALPRPLRPLP